MKPISGNITPTDEEEDNDSTVVASSTVNELGRTERRKKQSSIFWWALLIAAIVATAAWLALYGWGGRHEKAVTDNTAPAVEVNSVHNDEPVKPVVQHPEKAHRVRAAVSERVSDDATQPNTIDRYRDSVNVVKKRHQAANATPPGDSGSEQKADND